MLKRERWVNAARFAGVVQTHPPHRAGIWIEDAEWRRWCPDSDWRDFGPLWVKLKYWLGNYPKDKRFPTTEIYDSYGRFIEAEYGNSEHNLMQAGCLLAAAIGATMKEESK